MSALAEIGHNRPPITPFDTIKGNIDDLRVEAGNWLDGTEIKSQAEADEVGRLLDKTRKAIQAANDARVAEKEPYAKSANEVDQRYNTLIGKTKAVTGVAVLIEDGCKSVLSVWLKKVDDEKRARDEALRLKAAEAAKLVQIAATSDSIDEHEERNRAVDIARQAAFDYAAAQREKSQVKTDGWSIGLVTTYRPEIDDLFEAVKHYWATRKDDFAELVLKFAKEDIRQGKRQIAGIKVIEERSAR